jgi:uncharacterized iron-regulated membrane protein
MKLITQISSVIGRVDAEARAERSRVRELALLAHRYVGLAMATFLLVAGLTGSLLAFYQELDSALNPELRRVQPPFPGAPLLAPFELTERIQAQLPAGQEHLEARLDLRGDEAVEFWIEVSKDKWKEMFADPYTGAILGGRDWGVISLAPLYVMPFMYRLHYSLALDEVGTVLFGVVAVLWTIDCFIGAYITLPPRARRGSAAERKPWLKRWLPAWLVRASTLFSTVFTWHRASGLWVWAMLLVFAWSAVALNLPDVYNPLMRATVGMATIGHDALPELSPPYPKPTLTLNEAHGRARELMAEEARTRGFSVEREVSIGYAADHGAFWYRVASSLDISETKPRTQLYFNGQDGRFMSFEAATGIDAGNTITSWIVALHFGSVFGLPYRMFVSIMGIAVALLSVTGVWIWLRKRNKSLAR